LQFVAKWKVFEQKLNFFIFKIKFKIINYDLNNKIIKNNQVKNIENDFNKIYQLNFIIK